MQCSIRHFTRRVVVAFALAASLFALALAAIGPGASAARAQTAYLSELEDVPLMPGLSEVPDAGVVFDKPSGRIVEVYAHGAVGRAQVESFYREALPQLGWKAEGGLFLREGETLEIDYLGADGDLAVRFTLQPR
jgi:hypothetical protein